jgi:hypothetical protein
VLPPVPSDPPLDPPVPADSADCSSSKKSQPNDPTKAVAKTKRHASATAVRWVARNGIVRE